MRQHIVVRWNDQRKLLRHYGKQHNSNERRLRTVDGCRNRIGATIIRQPKYTGVHHMPMVRCAVARFDTANQLTPRMSRLTPRPTTTGDPVNAAAERTQSEVVAALRKAAQS